MIKRILSLRDFKILADSFDDEFLEGHHIRHYYDDKFQRDLLYLAWNNLYLLANDCIIVAHFDKPDHIDAFIWFGVGRDFRVDKNIAHSYIWFSRDKVNGVKVFLKAQEIILKRLDIDYMVVGCLTDPLGSSEAIGRVLCDRYGFKEEAISYCKKLR